MINALSIGKIIKQFRCQNNLTQEELAEKVDISKNYLSKVERGLSLLNMETFLKMAQILSFSLEDFGIKIQNETKNDIVKQEIITKILSSNQEKLEIYSKLINLADEVLIKK
ncbi:helix-turn-helix transcriptional regulator [bacterium]|nr:helix-turn-helix transcriptional regulator [bacterium]